jgi:pyrroloquinoline quinone biosynthesis protein B
MTVEAILLGTAQDGGIPQAGCYCARCSLARAEPEQRQWVSCLALVDHEAGQSWLLDATPDLREQVHVLHELAPDCTLAGIALTHAHMGHCTGLMHLGREAWNTQDLPVYASRRMADFLRENAPWSQLVELNNIELRMFTPECAVQLSSNLSLTPWVVPHRDEFSDTLAFVVRGPARQLFYCPDIDAWDNWDLDVRSFVIEMDVALLDGTFFSSAELPGRDLGEIPHPLVTDSVERLAGVDCDVRFIHLNHSNPLHTPGPEWDWLTAQGFGVGAFGARWQLG